MGFKISHLYAAPAINPVTFKARSIPFFNPVDVYGRVFFFSWFGFMIAFWAWYTFPPLLTHTIKNDLHLSPEEAANSNIVSLCATLLVRLVAGPLCDQIGPRKVFGGLLLVGSIPLGLAPLVHNATGLYVSRFFIGILGGAFVPCQVWSMGFFDKNIVGTANALTGGFGTAGGGITYLIMPAVYDGLVGVGHAPSQAWRLTFLVPLAMVITTAIALILLCPDTPTGSWADRHLHAQGSPDSGASSDIEKASLADVPGRITEYPTPDSSLPASPSNEKCPVLPIALRKAQPHLPKPSITPTTKQGLSQPPPARVAAQVALPAPTSSSFLATALTPQSAFHVLAYMCSFGSELAINSVLASYYAANFPSLSQTAAANYAAMFGFLNFVTRPLGGVVSDVLFGFFSGMGSGAGGGGGEAERKGTWWKKGWISVCGAGAGMMLVLIGRLDPKGTDGNGGGIGMMVGLVAVAAVFLQAGNGANFSLVPHVHPRANGVLSGLTGAGGNLGGVLFAVVLRFMGGGTDYAKGFWVIGVVNLVVTAAVCWIPPLPRGEGEER